MLIASHSKMAARDSLRTRPVIRKYLPGSAYVSEANSVHFPFANGYPGALQHRAVQMENITPMMENVQKQMEPMLEAVKGASASAVAAINPLVAQATEKFPALAQCFPAGDAPAAPKAEPVPEPASEE
jgi:hypothetical protein